MVYSPPCPWDTHYQFSIKTLLSNKVRISFLPFHSHLSFLHCHRLQCCTSCGVIWSRTWSHYRMVHRTPRASHEFRSTGCEQVAEPTPCSDGDHITPQDVQAYALGRCKWRYSTSYYRVICGTLLQILSLTTRYPPRRGALDVCGTARIFRLEYNMCMKNTSTMVNSDRSYCIKPSTRRDASWDSAWPNQSCMFPHR